MGLLPRSSGRPRCKHFAGELSEEPVVSFCWIARRLRGAHASLCAGNLPPELRASLAVWARFVRNTFMHECRRHGDHVSPTIPLGMANYLSQGIPLALAVPHGVRGGSRGRSASRVWRNRS